MYKQMINGCKKNTKMKEECASRYARLGRLWCFFHKLFGNLILLKAARVSGKGKLTKYVQLYPRFAGN